VGTGYYLISEEVVNYYKVIIRVFDSKKSQDGEEDESWETAEG
jgi:hypothetical protein